MTLVLIPPLGHDQKFYDPLVSLLSGVDIIRLDYPYFDSHFPWESEELINKLAHYFSEKITSFTEVKILGVSLGATISLKMKEILGDKISHLYLVSSGGHKVTNFRKEMILSHIKTLGDEKFLLNALEVGSDKAYGASEFQYHFHGEDHTHPKTYWKHFTQVLWKEENRQLARQPLIQLVKASVEVSYEDFLERFQQEITIIWGEQDKVFSMRFYEKFKKVCPQARFYLFAGAGHFSPLETPVKIKDILLAHEKAL